MAEDASKSDAGSAKSDLSGPQESEMPLATQRVLASHLDRFKSELVSRAASGMRARGSRTLTDADVADAYRDLTRANTTSKVRRVIGDGALIFGGVMLPWFTIHWLVTVAGAGFCAIGIYVREWPEG